MSISKYGRTAVAAAFAAVLAMPAALAQEEEESAGPQYLDVRVVNTRSDGTDEWIELQKQLKAAQDEDEEGPSRDVWRVVRGELDAFHIVSLRDDFASLDEQGGDGGGPPLGEAQAAWGEAITGTVLSRTQTIMRMHSDLTIPNPEGYEPNLLMLRYITLRQGQGDAFHTWLNDKLRPALQSGGATGVYFGHVAHGGNVSTCVIAGHAANWAEFDGPGPFNHLTEEAQAALFADWDSMVARHEVRTLAYQADLSY